MSFLVLQSFTLLIFVGIIFLALGWWLKRSNFIVDVERRVDTYSPNIDIESSTASKATSSVDSIVLKKLMAQVDAAKKERVSVYQEMNLNMNQGFDDLKSDMKEDRERFDEKIDSLEAKMESMAEFDSSQLGDIEQEQVQLQKQLDKQEQKIEKTLESISELKETVKNIADRPFKPVPQTKDDLRAIKGVGAETERLLNTHGIKKFEQIASLHAADIEKLSEEMHFAGRIKRDQWVDQAKKILRERKLSLESMGVSPAP